jgi:hypothetical protein
LRRQGLLLASKRAGFWNRPDALEHLKRLLVDPDASVRELALEAVKAAALLGDSELAEKEKVALARRVKALAGDRVLKARALAVLEASGKSAAAIEADVTLGRSRLLSFSTFAKKVNPLFYQAGEDQHACASCHGNHTILRIAEARTLGRDRVEDVMINYNSALKVVNLGDPEASLILRKPRSPHGAGGPDSSSPTGLSHVGGARWESTDAPAYRAILEWIQDAARSASGHDGEERYSADSYSPGYEPALAGDSDLSTIWHTEYVGASPPYPHELVIDLGSQREALGLLYVPRQDGPNGRVKDFEIRVSLDRKTWSGVVASGRWPNDPTFRFVPLGGAIARYVALRGVSEVEGRPFMSAAEVTVESRPIAPGQR